MKKAFKFYSVIWAVLLVLFNVVSFVSVSLTGASKYTPSFWIGYLFITIALIGQLICTYFALRENALQKTFYNLSLISTSYTGLIMSFVFGGLCMAVSQLPYWVGIILCALVLGLNVIAVVKAAAAVDLVSDVDKQVKESTAFIKTLIVDAEGLMPRAKSEAAKAECKKVYEAIRYSDPMSNNALSDIESEIAIKYNQFVEAVTADGEEINAVAEELVVLIGDRNQRCKLLK